MRRRRTACRLAKERLSRYGISRSERTAAWHERGAPLTSGRWQASEWAEWKTGELELVSECFLQLRTRPARRSLPATFAANRRGGHALLPASPFPIPEPLCSEKTVQTAPDARDTAGD